MNETEIYPMNTPKAHPRVPRAAALHDLSCFGRCALTVIDPVLSAMGIQCVPLPTALLSTHTGGFSDMYFLGLDDALRGISEHFERLGLKFDAVYTGFLGSAHQAELVDNFIDRFGGDNGCGGAPLVLVDPVMGDDGELYSACTPELISAMRRLCLRADVITPNVTEACLLADMPYSEAVPLSEHDPEGLGKFLAARLLGMSQGRLRRVVITGIHCGGSEIATATYDTEAGSKAFSFFRQPRVERDFPGTGDIFASVLLGGLMAGHTAAQAAEEASRFAADCAAYTLASDTDEPTRNGVMVEPLLGKLSNSFC